MTSFAEEDVAEYANSEFAVEVVAYAEVEEVAAVTRSVFADVRGSVNFAAS